MFMKTIHALPVILLLFASCGTEHPEEKHPEEQHSVPADVIKPKAAIVWTGLYSETLPCADCPGILTQLELRADSTFVLREKYLERDSVPNGRMGQWRTKGMKLFLNGKAEWTMGPKGLERLDIHGGPIDTPLPNTIHRVKTFGSGPMLLTGAYVYYADSHSFKPCGSAYAIPVAMDVAGEKGAGLELERTYHKKVKSPPAPLYVQVTATMRVGPAMEGDGQDEYIHIDKLEKVLVKQECP